MFPHRHVNPKIYKNLRTDTRCLFWQVIDIQQVRTVKLNFEARFNVGRR